MSIVEAFGLGFVRGRGSSFRTSGAQFISLKRMERSNSMHKYITRGTYYPRIKNYAEMRRVSPNIIPCEKFTPTYIVRYQNENVKWYLRDT